jgi:thiol-disulfide isomerase/thioredoxin
VIGRSVRHRTWSPTLAAIVAFATAIFPAPGRAAGPGKPVGAITLPPIEWRGWSRAAFDEARDKHRLVLLDITATWCHSCRVMAEESYADSAVIAEINASFVPIRVDYDLRPDIGDRYLTNGWPTTGVLSPSGHLLVSKTYLPPRDLHQFLAEAVRFYRTNHVQVERKIAEAERAVARTWEPDSLLPPSLSEEEYIDRNVEALRDAEDKEHGGFGIAPKTAHWDAISFLLRAADAKRDDSIRALAVRGAAAALALQDSVDGGFFHFALAPDWTKIRYERLLDDQASAISVLTRVYRATGEERFKDAAGRVRAFVSQNLLPGATTHRSTNGALGWRQSTAPDVRPRGRPWVDGDVYFRLSREARRKTGQLEASPTFTTDAAMRMWSAALMGDRSFQLASSNLRRPRQLAGLMKGLGGCLYHAASGTGRSGLGLLADQAASGNALLDEYEATRQEAALRAADSLAAWMRANLEDPVGGGFRYVPRDTAAIGRLKAGDKPEVANVEAATFFLRRYWMGGRQEDKDVTERTALFLRSGDKIVLDPARAELVLRLRQEPVRLLVIGGGDGKKGTLAWQLRTAALEAPVPEVVVRYVAVPFKAGGPIAWPDGPPPNPKSPAIYRWTATGWRGPVTDPAKLGDILDKPAAQP